MKRRFLWCFFLTFVCSLASCGRDSGSTEISGAIQGTTYHIKLGVKEKIADLETLKIDIARVFDDIDLKLSNYRDDSDISRFNQQQTLDWIPVPSELTYLVQLSQLVSQKTDGCFDLTIKPLFDLWGFSKTENRIPGEAEIHQALAHVGMDKIEVDVPGHRLRKRDIAVQIDLSSVGQGYTVAALARLLESAGIHNYLVEVGGEMKVKGTKSEGIPWRVAIEKPRPYTREVQRVLNLQLQEGVAIMTAGTYRRFFEDHEQVYSHILNPHTGRPVTHQLLSVTILHEDPTLADVWDTALLCAGENEAIRIAEAEHLQALLIIKDKDQLREYMSSDFKAGHFEVPKDTESVIPLL